MWTTLSDQMWLMKNIHVRKNSFCGSEEFYITIRQNDAIKNHLAKIIRDIQGKGLTILKITFIGEYGYADKYAEILSRYPTLFIGDNPNIRFNKKKSRSSLLIQAVRGIKDYKYIKKARNVVGIMYQTGGVRFLSVTGIDKVIDKNLGFERQVGMNYRHIESIIKKNGFQLENVYRFWNYMEDVAVNYSKFNQARNKCFEKNNIKEYPAATGIYAHLSGGAQVSIGLEAVESRSRISKRRIKSQMQCEAVDYGPKFSRAILVSCPKENSKKLYISGTSSVDKQGKSILIDNPNGNISYVVSCVEHLLKKNQLSLNDIVTSYAYFKNNQMHQEFKRIYENNNWTFPYNPFFVEICRDDFFFELECIAANHSSEASYEIFG